MRPGNEKPLEAYASETLSLDQLDISKHYSYADYLRWPFKEQVELIRGIIQKTNLPAPYIHQETSARLIRELEAYFEHREGEVLFAPFHVRLPDPEGSAEDASIFNVIQPDLCVISDPAKINDHGYTGAPDLIIEVLSQESAYKEMGLKFHLYEEHGVKEYWVVDPLEEMVDVYTLKNGRYTGARPSADDEVCSVRFPGLKLNVKELFKGIRPFSGNIVHEPALAYGPDITSLEQLDFSKLYSYADYFRWKFEERVELIKGFIHKMSPAPSPKHQIVSGNLLCHIHTHFKHKACQALIAPLDVRLPDSKKKTDDSAIYTVVQPDLCILCDSSKIDERGVVGAPDLIIEVLSPHNSKKDTHLKFDLYEENGVKEYWIADPLLKTIRLYTLHDRKYTDPDTFTEEDEIRSVLFPELKFHLGEVFM